MPPPTFGKKLSKEGGRDGMIFRKNIHPV